MIADEQGRSERIAFLDECGDHSLTKIDKDFPLFVLSLVLVRRSEYVETILPAVNEFKLRYWDHEGVNLHSRDIRKAEGPFRILQNPIRRQRFMEALSELMRSLPYELFVVGIRKQLLTDRYADATDPYQLALKFVMERLVGYLERHNQVALPLIVEGRGRNEDNELKATFYDLTNHGSEYVAKERFQKRRFLLQFHDKRENIAGIQLADLCAHPSARKILKPSQENRPYEIVKDHMYGGLGWGWKVFP